MRRGYAVAFFVVYAASLLVTGYALSDGLPLFALGYSPGGIWLTVGVALMFPYMTALIPAAIAFVNGARPRIVAAWAAFGLAFVAVGLPLLSQLIATAGLAVASTTNVDHGRLPRPNVIEFVTDWRGGGTGMHTAPCDALCQGLLTNNEVERVVVAAVRRSGKVGELTDRVGYRIVDMPGPCPATFRTPDLVAPATLAAAAGRRCLLADVGDTTRGDVTASNRFIPDGRRRVLEISSPSKGVVRRVTAPIYYVLDMPFHLTTVPADPLTVRLAPAARQASGPDTAGELARVLDLAVDRAAVDAEPLADRAVLEFVLAHPGSASIVKDWERPFQNTFYSMSVRKGSPLTAEDIQFVHAILREKQLADVSSVADLFANRQDLSVTEFATEILDRLETQGQADKSNGALARSLMRLSNDELNSYADRLLAIGQRAAPWSADIVRRLGQLRTDPSPVLGDLLTTPLADAAIVATCTAEAGWGPAMMPALKAYFATYKYSGLPARVPNALVNGIIALRRFGEAAYAHDLLAGYPQAVVSDIETAVARAQSVAGGCFAS